MFKAVRIGVLLVILVIVAGNAWLTKQRSASWDIPLEVVIYPVNGDNSQAADDYISGLDPDVFQPVERYMADEGKRFGITLDRPVTVEIAPRVDSLPPAAPFGGNVLQIILWSLKTRWWAWRADTYDGPGNIKVFVLYHDSENIKELDHSVGIEQGQVCIVKAFADRRLASRNNVIIVHEMLHTLGARDKYDAGTGLPFYPAGYADPDLSPLYPQKLAEIMGGTIPLSENEATMPEGLARTIVGPLTAGEIGWAGKSD
ncbi:MAG: hypothetical protein KKG47_13785 [Proteobacteria bacterium]|nr:hypothetical protein [Pseudomonadota bacterium]MBU1739080.1 hypothetical protein [Pseudomonadota bacterium]